MMDSGGGSGFGRITVRGWSWARTAPSLKKDDFKGPGRMSGFTLFEMLVVLIILSIIVGVSAPAIGTFLGNLAFRQELDRVTAHLRKYRLKAVTEGEKIVVWQEEGDFFAAPLKKDGSLWYEESENRSLVMEPAWIVFTPYSTVTPATFTLSCDNRRGIIKMDSLSGLPIIQ